MRATANLSCEVARLLDREMVLVRVMQLAPLAVAPVHYQIAGQIRTPQSGGVYDFIEIAGRDR